MGTIEAVGIAASLCREFEGFYAKPYLCPAGIPTQGYGTIRRPDGTLITLDAEPIDKETAELWLQDEIGKLLPAVLSASPGLILYPARLGAILSFCYNLGIGRYRASTLRKRVNAHDWEGARQQIKRWVRGGGKVLNGLVRRRTAEAAFI